jgi:signal transduction histidine kinase
MGAVAISPDSGQSMTAAFDGVLELIETSPASAVIPAGVGEQARANAVALLRACDEASDGLTIATVGYAAELLASVAVALAADPFNTRRLADGLQAAAAVPRVALGRELLRAGRLLELEVEVAIEVQLSLLLAFTGAEAISLWAPGADDLPAAVADAGRCDRAQALGAATAVLASDRTGLIAGDRTLGLRIAPRCRAGAALIALGVDPGPSPYGSLLITAAPILAVLLDRETPVRREQSQEPVADVVERRLARLRFDLHDGPQQDVYLLAQDLRLFRDQLRPMIAGDPDQDRALARLDDLEAQVVALDDGLRRLSTSAQSPVVVSGSLQQSLQQLIDAFAQRTGITPETDFRGDLTQLNDSRQIALVSLIREALSNIRKHSGAESVRIVIAPVNGSVTVEVSDDGTGFDPEAALAGARGAGRLGLVGMHERMRMLGGRTRIDSSPGGPTVISATLPPWPAGHAEGRAMPDSSAYRTAPARLGTPILR